MFKLVTVTKNNSKMPSRKCCPCARQGAREFPPMTLFNHSYLS